MEGIAMPGFRREAELITVFMVMRHGHGFEKQAAKPCPLSRPVIIGQKWNILWKITWSIVCIRGLLQQGAESSRRRTFPDQKYNKIRRRHGVSPSHRVSEWCTRWKRTWLRGGKNHVINDAWLLAFFFFSSFSHLRQWSDHSSRGYDHDDQMKWGRRVLLGCKKRVRERMITISVIFRFLHDMNCGHLHIPHTRHD